MANLKQKFIKPGRDYNYSEGVKVLADTAVYADQIVYVTSSSGPFLKVATADADGGSTANGRLLIAKHDIAAGSYGICLPWKLVTNVNTSSGSVGDAVYLADAPGSSVASNLTLTAPADADNIVVGRVTVDDTAGAILVNASAPETRLRGGSYAASANSGVAGAAAEIFRYSLANATAVELTMDYPVIVVDAHVYSAGTTAATITLYKGDASTGDAIVPIVKGTTADRIVYADGVVFDGTHQAIPKGTKLTAKKSAAAEAGDLMIVTVIRA